MMKFNCLHYMLLYSLLTSVKSTEKDTTAILQNERKLWNYLFKHYDNQIRPGNNSEPSIVFVYLGLIHIIGLDSATQTLHTQSYVWMKWDDISFHWNASRFGDINRLRVPIHMIWKPDILLYNSGDGKEINLYSDDNAYVNYNGHVYWRPRTTFISLCSVDLQYYPYDEHTCTLKLGSWTHDALLIDFRVGFNRNGLNEISNITTSYFIKNNEWILISIQGKRNEQKYDCCPEVYLDLDFYVRIKRRPNIFSLTLILTNILCTLTTLCIFFLHPYDGKRIIITIINLVISSFFLLFLCYHLPPTKNAVPIIIVTAATTASLTWIGLAISILLIKMTTEKWIIPVPEKMTSVFINTIGNILWITPDGAAFLYRDMDGTKILVKESFQDAEETNTTKEQRETENPNTKMWFTMAIILNRLFLILYILIIIILIIVMIS